MVKVYGGKGILFVCTKCRVKEVQTSSPPGQTELFGQMFEQFKELIQSINELSNRVKSVEDSKPLNFAAALGNMGGQIYSISTSGTNN